MPEFEPELNLSPSRNHRHLVASTRPALRYGGGSVREWQDRLRPKVSELLGMPDDERLPLDVVTWWEQEHELGTIEKLSFAAEPGSDIVAYFCSPAGVEPPYPTMICLQGHSTGMHRSIAREREDETVPMEIEGDRDFALSAMRNGFAALCIEQRGFGYRREQEQAAVSTHGCHDAAMHALMLGRTLAGERTFDVDRGIDYLQARGDIDLTRVGVMGNSGGGTVTTYAAALLDRVRFVMPSCSFCTYADSIMSIYHCADNYIPGLLRSAEQSDVLGLFAPKAVAAVEEAGADIVFNWDHFFPLSGEPDGKHFECWTMLGAWAEATSRVEIGALVACNSYRNPDLLADMARTVDHISGGRLILGIGAGWFARDYDEYGYEFGTAGSRLTDLSTALPRIEKRWAALNPRPTREIPVLIGGGGERKTLRYTAEHATIWHGFGDATKVKHKCGVLDEWCEKIGRDPAEIERSTGASGSPESVGEDLLSAGASLFTVGVSGPDYDLGLARKWIAWRDEYNSS